MVCVGIPVLGTKLNQYTLSDLNSLLANSLSYGSAKQIGCTDNARRASVALEFPCSEGGGRLSFTRCVEKYYIRNWYAYADRGNISAISRKAHMDKGRVNMEVGN